MEWHHIGILFVGVISGIGAALSGFFSGFFVIGWYLDHINKAPREDGEDK